MTYITKTMANNNFFHPKYLTQNWEWLVMNCFRAISFTRAKIPCVSVTQTPFEKEHISSSFALPWSRVIYIPLTLFNWFVFVASLFNASGLCIGASRSVAERTWDPNTTSTVCVNYDQLFSQYRKCWMFWIQRTGQNVLKTIISFSHGVCLALLIWKCRKSHRITLFFILNLNDFW